MARAIEDMLREIREEVARHMGWSDFSHESEVYEARFPDTGEHIGYVVRTKSCPYCGKRGEIAVTKEEADRLLSGEHPSRALPNGDPGIWEQIHTGFHSACYDMAFREEE